MEVPPASLRTQSRQDRPTADDPRPANRLAQQLAPRSPFCPPQMSALNRWQDLACLVFLLFLAAGLRAWLISHTEVAARDSIGFIRYAWQLERQPWAEVLRHSQQHPGYPAWLLAVSWPVRSSLRDNDALAMQLSAQLASAIAGVLLVIPMFYLGKELFDRRVAFWAAALFQCLPVSARIMSDALSEATFLLLTATALLCAVRALRGGSPFRFGLCGLCAGLTYLTRPEGVLLVASTSLVLIGLQAFPTWRRPWRRVLACGASLTVTAVIVGLPYVAATQQFTTKPTGRELLKTATAENGSQDLPLLDRPAVALTGRPLAVSLWAVWAQAHEKGSLLWCVRALLTELIKGFYYIAWLPALAALWWFQQRLRLVPGAWVLLVLCLSHGLVLLRLAMVMGYVSERHVLVLVLCGIFWAAAGLCALGSWGVALVHTRPMLGLLLPLAVACAGLPQSLKPLHANRAGHHAAGLWLAAHTQPADPITDPFCWAHYYAGRVFWEGLTPPVPEGHHVTGYVVVERPDREHARLPLITRAHQLAEQGQLVYHWPEERPVDKADVFVYAVPP